MIAYCIPEFPAYFQGGNSGDSRDCQEKSDSWQRGKYRALLWRDRALLRRYRALCRQNGLLASRIKNSLIVPGTVIRGND